MIRLGEPKEALEKEYPSRGYQKRGCAFTF